MLYRLLKAIVSLGVWLYYRKVKVVNKHYLPEEGPCILIANHPNTLMDAWIIGYVSKRPIYFMAKATLFSSPFKQRILRSLNMIPINRRGEGVIPGVSNQDSFEACYRILEEGKCLLVFPEGTSYLERHLRELKTGTARIALEVLRRNENNVPLKVIPMGLNYMQADRFRSDVLVHIAPPILPAEYYVANKEEISPAAKRLTEEFRVRLEHVFVNSAGKEEEELTESLHRIFQSKYMKQEGRGVQGELNRLKEIRDRISELSVMQAWKIAEIKQLQEKINWQLERLDIRADFLDRRFRSRMFLRQTFTSVLGLLIGLPLFLYGLIHNVIQYKLTDYIVPRVTKDPEYYAPLAVLIGLISYPVFYLLFLTLFRFLFDLHWIYYLTYFISMPLSGLITYYMNRYLMHVSLKSRFLFLWFNHKESLIELKQDREKLRALLFES
ncbi:MAG: hypothetical protein EP338_05765 [Bacteroidetes bacterium]|nr:MAG: hypothetical protein EP338_05765 [Bacteroidota bacterium]